MNPLSTIKCEKQIVSCIRAPCPPQITWVLSTKKTSHNSNIKNFQLLRKFIRNDQKVSIEKNPLINTIRRYVDSLSKSEHAEARHVFQEISNAPALSSWRVFSYEPGTGRGSRQFYSFAKKLSNTDKSTKSLSLKQLYEMMNTYYDDSIE